ncbi:magnesium transporter CorA family protein [Actibacterium sp. MT2.3-13A]|uniref:magnesium transporter CorA family protein n=1 Tax=Actibacterium sp. MT2.3-13A TaxID=2828332 RepID=UPI001BA56053|nr:magnesium transporter CorA family protein [Actibacterium sp. MT2.3-13A]
MLSAYEYRDGRLVAAGEALEQTIWIDLFQPTEEDLARAAPLAAGATLPSLADMKEIEISNRLYREGDVDVVTVMLPALEPDETISTGPVTFMLGPERLITIRHHAPRPFQTYPQRADKSGFGCATPEAVALGLTEEIVARLADLLERVGDRLDGVSRDVLGRPGHGARQQSAQLQTVLERVARAGDVLSRLRLSLLTLERGLGFLMQTVVAPGPKDGTSPLRAVIATQLADIHALVEHADFLSSKVSLVLSATMGMIDLAQNDTVRIVSVVAALFMPPTLIASLYGMNFTHMPELAQPWGYPVALALMVASAGLTFLFFKWRGWL